MQQITSLKGFRDLANLDAQVLEFIIQQAKIQLSLANFSPIYLPLLEQTSLFLHSIGETTDIVNKEIYSFFDKNNLSVCLRPEGTVSCARAYMQNGLDKENNNAFFYLGAMFRYERPQKGRYRQFYQLGLEVFADDSLGADLQVLMTVINILQSLGLKIQDDISLEINSLGTLEDREVYKKQLVSYLLDFQDKFDSDIMLKLEKNPLRILDTKDKNLQEILAKAPKISDYLNDDSKDKFNKITSSLDSLGISYTHNHRLVRGLDYYNDFVFEFTTSLLGTQNAFCSGGRYDGLFEKIGYKSNFATGCAFGLDRLIEILKLKDNSLENKINAPISLYLISCASDRKISDKIIIEWLDLFLKQGIKSVADLRASSLKSKLKKADKLGAKKVVILGDYELNSKKCILKSLSDGTQELIDFDGIMNCVDKKIL